MSTTVNAYPMRAAGTGDALLLVGRVLASAIFILSGWGKLMSAAATTAYLARLGVPVPAFTYWVVVAVELGGGLLFLLGVQTRLVGIGLAVFCVVSALLVHAHFDDRGQVINFQKNLSMAGGFLAFAAAGGGAFSADRFMSRSGAVR